MEEAWALHRPGARIRELPPDPRPRRRRRPGNLWERWGVGLLAVAWVFPLLLLTWQLAQIPANSSFESAVHRPSTWLLAQAGKPQRITPHPGGISVWYYDRGHFQVEAAVDPHGKVLAIRYLHQRKPGN